MASPAHEQSSVKSARAPAPHRILIVEDDPELRAAIHEDLADRGNEVIEARDGAEALLRMREHRPDVVVFDLLMPRMDGWQFRVAQRRDPELARTPVVAMSASGTAIARAVDADVYVSKPFTTSTLARAIEEVLTSRARRDELERAAHRDRLAALGTLAAGLAHEINNPLTYVLLDVDAALKALPLLDGADACREHIAGLLHQAQTGLERIRGVVRSVRILAQAEQAQPAPLDVPATVRSALAIVIHDVRARARLVTQLEEVPWVMAEEGRLGQVVLNLLLNAVQAIPEGRPDAHEIRVRTLPDEAGDAVIEVSDTGAGIPEHLLPRIFEPFFTTKPVGQGAGLGLSIAQGIVSSFGGTIVVDSQEGRGTTVRVILPPGRPHTNA
jgi:signal transduction histidine kinase